MKEKRVILLREETERPKVVTYSRKILVGSEIRKIKANFNLIYNNPQEYIFRSEDNAFGNRKRKRNCKKILQ